MKWNKRRIEILPGLKVDIEFCCIGIGTEIELKIHPQIDQGIKTVEYILNFETEFAKEFHKAVISGAIDWKCYNMQKTKKGLQQEIASDKKCLEIMLEVIRNKIEITKNTLKILEEKGGGSE